MNDWKGNYSLTPRNVLILVALFWTAIVCRVLLSPENHIGFNLFWLMPLFLFGAGIGFWFRDGKLGGWTIVACTVSMVLLLLMYFFNVLLPYEVWLRRGMPQRPF